MSAKLEFYNTLKMVLVELRQWRMTRNLATTLDTTRFHKIAVPQIVSTLQQPLR